MSEYLSGDYRIDNDKPYLHHYDLPKDHDLIVTIAGVKKEKLKMANGKEEDKQVLYFIEDVKPLVLNKKVNPAAITKAVGSPDREVWQGKKIALYVGLESKAEDGYAVRIRDYAPKTDEYYCEDCGELITDKTIDGKTYHAKAIANNAYTKFGRYLCYECAQKAKEADNGNM